jgi:hypothetical protein
MTFDEYDKYKKGEFFLFKVGGQTTFWHSSSLSLPGTLLRSLHVKIIAPEEKIR